MRDLNKLGRCWHPFVIALRTERVITFTVLLHFIWKTNVQDNPVLFWKVVKTIRQLKGALRSKCCNVVKLPVFPSFLADNAASLLGRTRVNLDYKTKDMPHILRILYAFCRKEKSLPAISEVPTSCNKLLGVLEHMPILRSKAFFPQFNLTSLWWTLI